jgi:uncharacterized membrane protein YesL
MIRLPGDLNDRLADVYLSAIPLIVLNVVWFLSCLPLVTAIPATGGLFYATNQLAHDKPADWRTFVEGFRSCFWLSWRWGVLNVVVIVVLGANLLFYTQAGTGWASTAQTAVFILLLLWTAIQLYTFPFLLEQADVQLRTAMRNSLVIIIKRPALTILVFSGIAIVIGTSTFLIGPAWAFITGSLCTYWANRAVIDSIAKLKGKTAQS